MTNRNDITGDKLVSKPTNEAFSKGWDNIFGKKEVEPVRVAVYGTLKKGRGNHQVMERAGGKLLGEDVVAASIYRYCAGFPAISLEPRHGVLIEVYEITDINPLDRLEGYPRFYNRSVIDTTYGKAWVYHMDDAELNGKYDLIESGVF